MAMIVIGFNMNRGNGEEAANFLLYSGLPEEI
jgi:hypothetical protein